MSQQKITGKYLRIVIVIIIVFVGVILTSYIITQYQNTNFNNATTIPNHILNETQAISSCPQGQVLFEGQCYVKTQPIGYGVDSLKCPNGYFMKGLGFLNNEESNCLLFAGQPLLANSTTGYTPVQVMQHFDQLYNQHIALTGDLMWHGIIGKFDCQDPNSTVNDLKNNLVLNSYTSSIFDPNAPSFEIETITQTHQKITLASPYADFPTGGSTGFTFNKMVTIHGTVQNATITICGVSLTRPIFLVDPSDLDQFTH